jgi:hypothetical protein
MKYLERRYPRWVICDRVEPAARPPRLSPVIASVSEAIHAATLRKLDGFVASAPRHDGVKQLAAFPADALTRPTWNTFGTGAFQIVVPAKAGTHTALSSRSRQDDRHLQQQPRPVVMGPCFRRDDVGHEAAPTSSRRAPTARIRRRRSRSFRSWSAVPRRS